MSRLVLVSSHLPRLVGGADAARAPETVARGLASALRAPHEAHGGLWIGRPDDVAPVSGEEGPLCPVVIDPDAARGHRETSESVLWPLLHYQLESVRLDATREWAAYRAVNEAFAEAVVARWRDGDRVWIHDYPLALVPELVRRRLPRARIGFFLHAPFPAGDVFRLLPWREEIIRGVLGADLVGFNTATHRSNFARAACAVLGLDLDLDELRWAERRVQLGVFPVGVDAAALAEPGDPDEISVRGDGPRHAIVLGVDRLDRTKGIMRRLHAFDRLLTESPEQARAVKLVQVVVPSRDPGGPSSALGAEVHELVGRINARHGSPGSVPIHCLTRALSRPALTALYRSADVMLVTPLRDGMNLVAKEYVAARTDGRGVLVLSEFAGAAEALREALVVNPYDIDAITRALRAALAMPDDEQRLRMSSLRAEVLQHDVHAWYRGFLAALDAVVPSPAWPVVEVTEARASLEDAMSALRLAPSRVLFLDYDGTLVPFAPLPDLAVPDPALLALLAALAQTPGTSVEVVTGRAAASIERLIGTLPIGLHAEHGYWSRRGPGQPWLVRSGGSLAWKTAVAPIMTSLAARTPGALVEPKTAALAFHYRRVDATLAAVRLRELRTRIEALALPYVELLEGAKVLEVRLAGVHKGLPAADVLRALPADTAVFAVGDDRTDEDLFAAIPSRGITVSVGTRPSRATYRITGPSEVRALLARLVTGTPALRGPVLVPDLDIGATTADLPS